MQSAKRRVQLGLARTHTHVTREVLLSETHTHTSCEGGWVVDTHTICEGGFFLMQVYVCVYIYTHAYTGSRSLRGSSLSLSNTHPNPVGLRRSPDHIGPHQIDVLIFTTTKTITMISIIIITIISIIMIITRHQQVPWGALRIPWEPLMGSLGVPLGSLGGAGWGAPTVATMQ